MIRKELIIAIIGIVLFIILLIIIISIKNKKNTLKKELTVQEFFSLRDHCLKTKVISNNWSGAYILYNQTKNMYYVGQGENIINRINMHFTGKGNGDVYADYKNKDVFLISYELLKNCPYENLNDLERKLILKYDSFASGYNKTRGNRTNNKRSKK